MEPVSSPSPASAGLSVDAKGEPVIDPTKNVLNLIDAASQRQDDLREAADRRVTAEIAHAKSGPSLETYVEKRLLIVCEDITLLRALGQREVDHLRTRMESAFTETDLRYQQRFDAQAKALEAAFQAAKEAVQAALSAADRAVSKAELASDKRFEALNELRQMLNDTLKGLMTRSEVQSAIDGLAEKIGGANNRMNGLEQRLNVRDGEQSGNRRQKDDTRAYLAVGVSLVLAMMAFSTWSNRPRQPDAQVQALQQELRELRDQRSAAPPQVIYTPAPPGTQLPTVPPGAPPR